MEVFEYWQQKSMTEGKSIVVSGNDFVRHFQRLVKRDCNTDVKMTREEYELVKVYCTCRKMQLENKPSADDTDDEEEQLQQPKKKRKTITTTTTNRLERLDSSVGSKYTPKTVMLHLLAKWKEAEYSYGDFNFDLPSNIEREALRLQYIIEEGGCIKVNVHMLHEMPIILTPEEYFTTRKDMENCYGRLVFNTLLRRK